MDAEQYLNEAMLAAGIEPQGSIDWSNTTKYQRFQAKNSRSRAKPLFLKLHGGGATFGDWREDPSTFKTIWFDGPRPITTPNKTRELLAADAIYRSLLMLIHKSHHGPTCFNTSLFHPYVIKKNIIPYYGLQIRSSIVLPITNIERKLISLQFIKTNGFKQFKKNASPKNGMLFLAEEIYPTEIIKICEGWATGCSIYQAFGAPVIIAFSAHNLCSVALAIRKKYPQNKILICGDNDFENEKNTGKICGVLAAKKSKAELIFPPSLPGVTDWNDFYNISEEVASRINKKTPDFVRGKLINVGTHK